MFVDINQKFVPSCASASVAALSLGSSGLNLLKNVGTLSGAALGGSYWLVNSLIKDKILNQFMPEFNDYQLGTWPEKAEDKVLFIAAHVSDFAVKACLAWGILAAVGSTLPLSTAVLTLAASRLLYIYFTPDPATCQNKNLCYAMITLVTEPINQVAETILSTVLVYAEVTAIAIAEYTGSCIEAIAVVIGNEDPSNLEDLPVAVACS